MQIRVEFTLYLPQKIVPPENGDRVEFTLYAPPANRSP